MGVGEVIGGAALVGVATLLGLSWAADDEAESSGSPTTTILVYDPTTAPAVPTTTPTSDVTLPDSIPQSTESTPAGSSAPETTATASSPPPTSDSIAATTEAPVDTLSSLERASIAVQVVNGSGVDGAAAFVSDVLRLSAFEPADPADAVEPITTPQGAILFATGEDEAAGAVATALDYGPEQVLAAPADDPNWIQFGGELQVLVIVGP